MGLLHKNMVLRIFMTLCALAQVAAVMPHHHHQAEGTPCINPLHCVETRQHSHTGELMCGEPGTCPHRGSDSCRNVPTLDSSCGPVCGGHLCLHNMAGHRHSENGNDCSLSHLDLNPPTKDKVSFEAPVLNLVCASVLAFPSKDGGHYCEHFRTGEVMCCSVLSGTLNLYSDYCSAALPPRAPSC